VRQPNQPVKHWYDHGVVDYDGRSETLQDLVDHANESDKKLAEQHATMTGLLTNQFRLIKQLEEKVKRLERRVDNNTDYGTGHGY